MPSNFTIFDGAEFDPSATTRPPWKSGSRIGEPKSLRSAVHPVAPSLVMAETVLPDIANTSAMPVGLGTAGKISSTAAPLTGLDHSTGPGGKTVPTCQTVTAS